MFAWYTYKEQFREAVMMLGWVKHCRSVYLKQANETGPKLDTWSMMQDPRCRNLNWHND